MNGNLLLEVSPYNPATSTTTTVRMAMVYADATGTQLDGYQWLPVITSEPEIEIRLANGGVVQEIEIAGGAVSFQLGPQFGNEDWSLLSWDGALFRMFAGDMGQPFSAYRQVLAGTTTPISRDGAVATINLVAGAPLLTNLLSASYAGTGSAEGTAEFKGKLKPFAIGQCDNVEPLLIDPVKFIYQYHGYGQAQGTVAVYELSAINLGPATTSAATYAALAALTLQPGQWADCPNLGMFRLGAEPTGKITADVRGHKSANVYVSDLSTIVPALLQLGGVVTGKINQTSFNAFSSYGWSNFYTEQVAIGDVAREAMLHAAGYLFPDSSGVWRAGTYYGSKAPIELRADRSARPLVDAITQTETTAPVWKVRIGNRRVFSVNSASEISPALSEAIKDGAAAQAAADAAQDTADLAAAQGELNRLAIANIASDGVLDTSEKTNVVRLWGAEQAEKAGIEASASSFSVSSTAYTTAYNALSTYLTGLSPAYTDYTQNTAIDRTVFIARWNALESAKTALLRDIARFANTLAGGGMSMPAATVITATTNFNTRNDRIATAIAAPTFPTDGSALEHDLNQDGSANIAVKWSWSGSNDDIDGWELVIYSSDAATPYVIGTTPAAEAQHILAAPARQMTFYGVPANRFYTIYATAYRNVDKDINAAQVIRSASVKSTASGENPYRPSATVNFTGSIGGVPVSQNPVLDTTPPAQVTGVVVTSDLTTAANGEQTVTMKVVWTAISNVASYVIEIIDGAGTQEIPVGGGSTTWTGAVPPNFNYQVRVKAISLANVSGAYSVSVSHTTKKDTTPPGLPTAFTLLGAVRGFVLNWTNPTDADLAGVEVWSGSTNVVGSASRLTTEKGGYFRSPDVAAGTTAYFWLRSIDTSGNVSAFTAVASATTVVLPDADLSTQIQDKISQGVAAAQGTVQYRNTGAPTNNPTPTGITITANSNGTRNVRLDWATYTQGAKQADFLMIFSRRAGTAPTLNDAAAQTNVNTTGASYYVFEGISPTDIMSFGIAAVRRTENGVEAGPIQSHATWTNVSTARPNFTGDINNIAANTISAATVNFNTRNDRSSSVIPSVTMKPLDDVDHTLNTDGSANISVEWDWAGSSDQIDGFVLKVRQGKPGSARSGASALKGLFF